VEKTMDREHPRSWYYALMDYGSMLPKVGSNANKRSKHYSVQSKFEGSDRQIRGAIIRSLLATPSQSLPTLADNLSVESKRLRIIVGHMVAEGFVRQKKERYYI